MPGLDFLGEFAKLFSSQEASREMQEFLKHLAVNINSLEEFQKSLEILGGLEFVSSPLGRKKKIHYKKE